MVIVNDPPPTCAADGVMLVSTAAAPPVEGGNGADSAVGIHLTDAEVGLIRDEEELAGRIHGDIHWIIQGARDRGAAVAEVSGGRGARHGGDDSGGADLADAIVAVVGNVDI